MESTEDGLDLNTILDKFYRLNQGDVTNEIISNLKSEIKKIYDLYKDFNEYKKEQIIEKENSKKQTNLHNIDFILIAEMIYKNKKYFGFIPRKIQIISLLYFLKKDKKKGVVQQINTGEGKSCIISFLAVYLAIKKNKKIDILTSSPVLAKRDALKFKDFYKSFNLTVDYTEIHNDETKKNNSIFCKEPYKCYLANIVYGDALSFEGDILRTNFMGIMGRGEKRKFDCIIIDEIDNIALDNLKNTTELLDSFHGFKFLEYVYFFIYKKLKEITDNDKKNILEKKEEIIDKLNQECLEEFKDIKKLEEKNIYIPNHLQKYINRRLSDWCESAYLAKFIYHNDENYIMKKDKEYDISVINPIDFYNTGTTQENSVWSGLHQLLEIREKKMLTEENLSSCYMSNLSFFNKYIKTENNNIDDIIENNIYGLTGTIGSEYNKKTLKFLYKLDSLIIPSFKESLLKIEEPNIIILKNNNEENKNSNGDKNKNQENVQEKWFKSIQNKIIEIVRKKRAVLVIFQYISEAKRMYNVLKNNYKNIILYSRSDLNEGKFLEYNIEPEYIILSTNLSGRGTDINISERLNKNGGLHVILTYEPFNQRIERQAFGRAGRKGQNGSAGKIIISSFTQEEAIKEMNKREEEESNFLIDVYKEKIYVFEKIFDKFSKFISEIYELTHDNLLLLDLKERWGRFLIKHSLNNIEKQYKKNHEKVDKEAFKKLEDSYDYFEKKLRNYYYNYDLNIDDIKNVFSKAKNIYYNKGPMKYKFKNGLYLNKYDDEEKINEGIKLCPYLCLGGYMLLIFKKINFISEIKEMPNDKVKYYINKIKKDFEELINNIKLLIKQFKTYQEMIAFFGYNKDDLEISIQNKQKMELMENIKVLMENNLQKLKEYDNFNNYIIAKRIKLRDFIAFKKLKINPLVFEYFKDYGLYLFTIEEKSDNNCLIY